MCAKCTHESQWHGDRCRPPGFQVYCSCEAFEPVIRVGDALCGACWDKHTSLYRGCVGPIRTCVVCGAETRGYVVEPPVACPKCGAPSRPSKRIPGLVCTSTMCGLLFRPRTPLPAPPRGRQLLQRVALMIQDAREEAESVEGGIARLYVGAGVELADQVMAWSAERERSEDPIGHYCPKCGAAFEVYAKPGERVLLCGSCGWVEGSGPEAAALVQEFVAQDANQVAQPAAQDAHAFKPCGPFDVPVSRNLVMVAIADALTEARGLGRKYADPSGTPSIAAECGYLRAALRSLVVRLRDGGAL